MSLLGAVAVVLVVWWVCIRELVWLRQKVREPRGKGTFTTEGQYQWTGADRAHYES
jgi:predicted secreted protein